MNEMKWNSEGVSRPKEKEYQILTELQKKITEARAEVARLELEYSLLHYDMKTEKEIENK